MAPKRIKAKPGGGCSRVETNSCGEGRNITRANMLDLARQGGVDAAFAQTAMDRALAVAQTFTACAIRPATVKTLRAAIEANQRRMA